MLLMDPNKTDKKKQVTIQNPVNKPKNDIRP